jgi:hypothetical protein
MRKFLNKIATLFGYEIVRPKYLQFTNIKNPGTTNIVNGNNPIKTHMFWAYGDLTMLEKLAAVSFVANGFDLKFWTYGLITNLPNGIELCDARKIIPENRVFKSGSGSYALFADLFRYAVLREQGGLWADTDVVCLASSADFKYIAKDGFLVTERTRNSIKMNNNLIYHPKPIAGDRGCTKFCVNGLMAGNCQIHRSGYDRSTEARSTQGVD